MRRKYRVLVYEDPEEAGVWLAKVPTVAGVLSDGDSRKEALANVREALEVMLVAIQEWGEDVPLSDLEITDDFIELELSHLIDSGNSKHSVLKHPDGRRTIIPFHREEMKQGTYKAILEQIGMTEEEFEKL